MVRRGCNVQYDDVGSDRVRGRVAARKFGEFEIELDQQQFDCRHTLSERKAGGADTGAEIHHTIA